MYGDDRLHITLLGSPAEIGGANTEAWHWLKMMRRSGAQITVVHTWGEPPIPWRRQCEAIGCRVDVFESPSDIRLRVGVDCCVAFCNERIFPVFDQIAVDCPIIWVNCMTWLLREELQQYRMRRRFFDAYIFQSEYQQAVLMTMLQHEGLPDGTPYAVINGALDVNDFPYTPRLLGGEPLTVGRISRAAPDKFHPDHWRTLQTAYDMLYAERPAALKARVLGFSKDIERRLSDPTPHFAECIAECCEDVNEFYRSLHVMSHFTGGSRENWPRVGLEAMAAGVAVIAEDDFGWPEMIERDVSGVLLHRTSRSTLAWHLREFARDDMKRLAMCDAARLRVCELCEPSAMFEKWSTVIKQIAGARLCRS